MPLQKNTIIIDANVILRYLLKDNKKFYKEAEALFDDVFSGKKKIWIMHSVIAEVVYVLLKLYSVPRKEIAEVLTELVKIKGVNVQDKEILLDAFKIFKNRNLDFVDCFLCAYSKKYRVISFDKKLNKCIKELI
ncbi:MAG: PIN domain-containing protein [Thermodesulfobacterium sp.]|nr:PIN domain-containing protein [Thermodesulfobacterium sp.]